MARPNYMKKSDAPAVPTEPDDLEFPDWSGMDDRSPRVTADSAFQLCEEYPVWFPDLLAKWQGQRPEKCLVEFVL